MASRQTDTPLWAMSICHHGGTLSVCVLFVCFAKECLFVGVYMNLCTFKWMWGQQGSVLSNKAQVQTITAGTAGTL